MTTQQPTERQGANAWSMGFLHALFGIINILKGAFFMQKLIDLLGEKDAMFVELANNNLKAKFMQQAEDEGFVINGDMPTKHKAEGVMIIRKDYTIGYLRGFVAHTMYYALRKTDSVDYRRLINNWIQIIVTYNLYIISIALKS